MSAQAQIHDDEGNWPRINESYELSLIARDAARDEAKRAGRELRRVYDNRGPNDHVVLEEADLDLAEAEEQAREAERRLKAVEAIRFGGHDDGLASTELADSAAKQAALAALRARRAADQLERTADALGRRV